jgi:hypothetical protein
LNDPSDDTLAPPTQPATPNPIATHQTLNLGFVMDPSVRPGSLLRE